MRRDSRNGRNGQKVRVLVVDDQDFFRVGLCALLDTAGVQVVANARIGEEAVALAARVMPDVVLLGLDHALAARAETWRMAEVVPDAKIIALTETGEPNDVVDCLAAGAYGYLAKNDSTDTIVSGIVRAAAASEPLLSSRTTEALIHRLRSLSAERMRGELLPAKLSPREIEVLALIAQGYDNAVIARHLFISPHTVKHHVHTICGKLGVQNRVQAAVRAARAGLV